MCTRFEYGSSCILVLFRSRKRYVKHHQSEKKQGRKVKVVSRENWIVQTIKPAYIQLIQCQNVQLESALMEE